MNNFLLIPVKVVICFPLYNLNKYMANILKAEMSKMKIRTPRIMLFSNYIKNVPIEDDDIVVSFDVTSLYKSTPIIDTLNIIRDYVNNDDLFTRKAVIPYQL